MDLLQLLILLVLAGICGALAELIIGYKPGNLLVSVIIGVIGAYLGGVLTYGGGVLPMLFPVRVGPTTIDIVWTTLGSLVVLLLLAVFRGHPTRVGYLRRPRSVRR